MDETLSLGEYLRRARRKSKKNLQELADETGLSISHLSRLENDNALPSADAVVKLAKALEADLEQMLRKADCLPQEILDRLVRRTGQGAAILRRTAGTAIDPGFGEALIGDIDPVLRTAIANQLQVAEADAGSLLTALEQLSRLSSTERDAILVTIAGLAKGTST